MITVIMISITEKMKRIILANLYGHKLSYGSDLYHFIIIVWAFFGGIGLPLAVMG